MLLRASTVQVEVTVYGAKPLTKRYGRDKQQANAQHRLRLGQASGRSTSMGGDDKAVAAHWTPSGGAPSSSASPGLPKSEFANFPPLLHACPASPQSAAEATACESGNLFVVGLHPLTLRTMADAAESAPAAAADAAPAATSPPPAAVAAPLAPCDKPNREVFEAALAALNAELEGMQGRRDKIQGRLASSKTGNDELNAKLSSARLRFAAIK